MTVLYVAWQDPKDRQWIPVGRLSFDGHLYCFVYTKGAQQSPNFLPFGGMLELTTVYESRELFPLFANRLLAKTRPEYPHLLDWVNIPHDHDDPLVLLARTGGMRETDSLAVFPCPERQADGTYVMHFFSHGIRYLPPPVIEAVDTLAPGDRLLLMPDPQNAFDRDALALRTASIAMIVGYCPRYLSRDFLTLLEANPETTYVIVERVSRDAPIQLRLFCSLTAPWPAQFQPCAEESYLPLA
jgi:HIRAN domain